MPLSFDRTLFAPGDRILVAVSGGVDSLALLHGLAASRDELQIEVVAVHVHHGMRGEAADADVEFLRACCAAWEVPFEVRYADVPERARTGRISVEEAGRDARYEALGELAALHHCNKVATAHHADDQAETILLNLFRGAGLDGLAGIPTRRLLHAGNGAPELIRPLLGARRADLDEYCRAHALEPRFDSTNQDLYYRRNRVRQQLLPALEAFDPAIVPHLARVAEQARSERELFHEEAAALLERARASDAEFRSPIPLPIPYSETALHVAVLLEAPEALRRRALRLALRRVGGFDVELDAELVARVTGLLAADGGAIDLPGCPVRLRRLGELLRFEPKEGRRPAPVAVEVPWPGQTAAPAFGLLLESYNRDPTDDLRLPPHEAVFDAGSLRGSLHLHAPEPATRFRPLNSPGTRLLSDLFIDRRIPAILRPAWPVLSDEEGIIWVLGLAIAHRVRVTAETRIQLRMSVLALL
jgi:tRNA(Ile)-lysidine synthase